MQDEWLHFPQGPLPRASQLLGMTSHREIECREPFHPLRVGNASEYREENAVQLGSLCLCVNRQTLPGWLQGSQNIKLGEVPAIDSKEESDLDGSALTRKLFGPANATVSA
jgi:hypothetical protein